MLAMQISSNSISFSVPKSVIIVSLEKKKESIKLSVEDEGIGFKEKNTHKIFERFYSDRQENIKNHTGLGLSIAREIIEHMNGNILNPISYQFLSFYLLSIELFWLF